MSLGHLHTCALSLAVIKLQPLPSVSPPTCTILASESLDIYSVWCSASLFTILHVELSLLKSSGICHLNGQCEVLEKKQLQIKQKRNPQKKQEIKHVQTQCKIYTKEKGNRL